MKSHPNHSSVNLGAYSVPIALKKAALKCGPEIIRYQDPMTGWKPTDSAIIQEVLRAGIMVWREREKVRTGL